MRYEQDEDYDEPLPREPEEIEMFELSQALCGLTMLGEDTFLRMQATNIALIDKWLMPLEAGLRGWQLKDERPDFEVGLFLNAQSQMWLFAVYELLRTWRARAKKILNWAVTGGFAQKIAALEKDQSYQHVSRMAFARQLKKIEGDPSILPSISDDLARTHIIFGQLEFLRIALAKHEVSGKPKQMANAPGHARIDKWTGSLSYELSNGALILGEVTRRSFADSLRFIATDRSIPSQAEIESFDAFMKLSPADSPFGPTEG